MKKVLFAVLLVPFLMMSSVMAAGKVTVDRGRDAGSKDAGLDGGTPEIPDAAVDVKITRRIDLYERLMVMKQDIEKEKGPLKAFDVYWSQGDINPDMVFLTVNDGSNKVGLVFVFTGDKWELLENTFRAP
jgi:hypothetical protein